jgi:3-phenylpropionate/cinnamic acid dioxygenase small subunit
MNKIGIKIRKMDIQENGKKLNPTRKNLFKQIKTLHIKLKKNDKYLTTTFVIEKDKYQIGKYHTHLLINYNDKQNLNTQLSRFIGGSSWEERNEGLDTINGCNGKYGEVDTHLIYDEVEFINYMNKHEQTETLV